MTLYTHNQAVQLALNAGFSASSATTIAAIAEAESGLQSHGPDNINTDGTRDRGILQFNSFWHPEVLDSCAYDPVCAFNAAYRVSEKGTNFNQWATYTEGKYLPFMNGYSGDKSPPVTTLPIVSTVQNIGSSVHKTLNTVPGFLGIVDALDEIEQFQPLVLKSGNSYPDFKLFGQDTGIQNDITLPSDNIQAILVFTVVNMRAFSVRALVVTLGVIIVIGLVTNIMDIRL